MNGISSEEIRTRHGLLIDKKFLEGLTEEEEKELVQINCLLDTFEEKYYATAPHAISLAALFYANEGSE